MATIVREFLLDAAPDEVWDAARDVGALHTRLVPGFVARERIVDVDDARRRIAWSVVGSAHLEHHNASLQLFADGARTRAVWIADVLPNAAAPAVDAMIGQGIVAMQRRFAAASRAAQR